MKDEGGEKNSMIMGILRCSRNCYFTVLKSIHALPRFSLTPTPTPTLSVKIHKKE